MGKSFGEDISNVLLRCDLYDLDERAVDFVSEEEFGGDVFEFIPSDGAFC